MAKEGKNICILPRGECCGCGACQSCCPVKAISLAEEQDGFSYPVVDEDLCIHCQKCVKVCPELNPRFENDSQPQCYAAYAPDEIRMESSSGGIFTLLAEDVFSRGGCVCGVALNEEFQAEHRIAETKEELARLRGSKYVQSRMGDIYQKVKKLLQEERLVLFTGVPCQVAALKGYLGREYENLLTADVICHGVPSPGLFRKYVREKYGKNKLASFQFRTKEFGHNCNHCIATLKNGKRMVGDLYNDPFEKAFHRSLMLREVCGDCKFAPMPRQGDLTLGDFWGIAKYNPDYADPKGVSLVLVNSGKGKAAWERIQDRMPFREPVPLDFARKHNRFRSKIRVDENRDAFFVYTGQMSFQKAVQKAFGEKFSLKTEAKRAAKKLLPQSVIEKLRK